MNKKSLLLVFFFGFVTCIFLILSSLLYNLYDEGLYINLQNKSGVFEHFDNDSLIEEKNNEVISFLKEEKNLNDEFFTENEISHLNDVKKLFNILKIIYYVLIFLIIANFIYFYFNNDFLQNLINLLIINLGICFLLVLIFYFFPFESLFDKMHELLFPQGNYSFNPETSNLINLFPIGFFIGFSQKLIFDFLLMELAIIFVLFFIYVKKNTDIFKTIFK